MRTKYKKENQCAVFVLDQGKFKSWRNALIIKRRNDQVTSRNWGHGERAHINIKNTLQQLQNRGKGLESSEQWRWKKGTVRHCLWHPKQRQQRKTVTQTFFFWQKTFKNREKSKNYPSHFEISNAMYIYVLALSAPCCEQTIQNCCKNVKMLLSSCF